MNPHAPCPLAKIVLPGDKVKAAREKVLHDKHQPQVFGDGGDHKADRQVVCEVGEKPLDPITPQLWGEQESRAMLLHAHVIFVIYRCLKHTTNTCFHCNQ